MSTDATVIAPAAPDETFAVPATAERLARAAEALAARGLTATPEVVVGSVAAVTETGSLLAVSASGSQIPAYGEVRPAGSGWSAPRRWCPTCPRRCGASRPTPTRSRTPAPAPPTDDRARPTRSSSSTASRSPGAARSCCCAGPSAISVRRQATGDQPTGGRSM